MDHKDEIQVQNKEVIKSVMNMFIQSYTSATCDDSEDGINEALSIMFTAANEVKKDWLEFAEQKDLAEDDAA